MKEKITIRYIIIINITFVNSLHDTQGTGLRWSEVFGQVNQIYIHTYLYQTSHMTAASLKTAI